MARRVKISQLPVLTEITPGDVIIVNDENVVTSGITVPNFITSIFSYEVPVEGTLDFTNGGVKNLFLNDLEDVTTSGYALTDGQALVYDSNLKQWVPGDPVGGGGGSGGGGVSDTDTIIDGGDATPDSGTIINGPGGLVDIDTSTLLLANPTRFAHTRTGLPPSSGLATQQDANIWFYESILILESDIETINNNGTGPNVAFEVTAPLTVSSYDTNVKNYVHGLDIRTLNTL